jgi:antitoxin component of RelBE/YafQ-DinJ toxin-antitoxin module
VKSSFIKFRITDEEYIRFQKTCENKGKTMSDVIRSFITSYSDGENIIILDLDKNTLKNTADLCREKKLKFNDLVKFLLEKAIKNKDKFNFK